MNVDSVQRLPRRGAGVVSVVQIVQRSPNLLAISGPVCGSLGKPLAVKRAQRSYRQLATSSPVYGDWSYRWRRGPRGWLATSIPNLMGKQVIYFFPLKRQPFVLNIPGFPSAHQWGQGPLCSQWWRSLQTWLDVLSISVSVVQMLIAPTWCREAWPGPTRQREETQVTAI